jgi:hypothetical protein
MQAEATKATSGILICSPKNKTVTITLLIVILAQKNNSLFYFNKAA